jgi:hypothetical protein
VTHNEFFTHKTHHRDCLTYTLDLSTESAHSESAFAVTGNKITQDDWSLWHPRLAHVSDHFTDRLYQVADGVPQLKKPKTQKLACDPCIRAKQVRLIHQVKNKGRDLLYCDSSNNSTTISFAKPS